MAIDTRTIGQLSPRDPLLITDRFEIEGNDGLSYSVSAENFANFVIAFIPSTGHVIQDAGTPLTNRPNLNFIGFTVADNPETDSTNVTSTAVAAGITSINTDETPAQVIAAGTGLQINNEGATHTLAIGTHTHATAIQGGQLVPSIALNTSGAPSQTTFLRGDNAWVELPADNSGITSINDDDTAAQVIAAGTGIILTDEAATHTFAIGTHTHATAEQGGQITNTGLTAGVYSAITGLGVQSQNIAMGNNNLTDLHRIDFQNASGDDPTYTLQFGFGGPGEFLLQLLGTSAQLNLSVVGTIYGFSSTEFNMANASINAVENVAINSAGKLLLDGLQGNTYLTNLNSNQLRVDVNGQVGFRIYQTGSDVNTVIGSTSQLATTATAGFLYLPNVAGTPTGTVTQTISGKTAFIFDRVNGIMYYRTLTDWVALAGGGGSGITSVVGGTGITATTVDGAATVALTAGVQSTITGLGVQTQNLDMNDSNILLNMGGANGSISADATDMIFTTPAIQDGFEFDLGTTTVLSIDIGKSEFSVPVEVTALRLGSASNGIVPFGTSEVRHTVGADRALTFFNDSASTIPDVAVGSLAALALTATTGFLYIPAMAGIPTGTPVGRTGKTAIAFDTVGGSLYAYDGAAWTTWGSGGGSGITSLNTNTEAAQVIEGGVNLTLASVGGTHTMNLPQVLTSMNAIIFTNISTAPATSLMALYRQNGNWYENIPNGEFKVIRFGGTNRYVFSAGSFRLQNNELRFRDNLHMTSTSDNDLRIRINSVTEYEFDAAALDCNGNNITDIGTITVDTITTTATDGLTITIGTGTDITVTTSAFDMGSRALQNAPHNHTDTEGGGQLNATTALNAAGTTDATTFLRGDNTWAVITAGGAITAGVGLTLDETVMSITAGVQATITGLGAQTQDLDMNDHDIILHRVATNNTEITSTSLGSSLNLRARGTTGIAISKATDSGAPEIILGTATLAVTDTRGFIRINSVPGVPTGTPVITAGTPLIYNSAANTIHAYSGGSWNTIGGGGGSGITSLNTLTGATQTFAGAGGLTISSAGTVHTITAPSRIHNLNAQTGGTQTFASGTGITVASNSNIHTFSLESSVVTVDGLQTLTAKTLTSPVIGNFTNAEHTHATEAAGGQLSNTALASGTYSNITGLGQQSQNLNMSNNGIIGIANVEINAGGFLRFNGSNGNTNIRRTTNTDLVTTIEGIQAQRLDPLNNQINTVFGVQAPLQTSTTSGFIFVPALGGTPTGTPARAYTGKTPIVFDSATNSLWGYNGGVWNNLGGSGGSGITTLNFQTGTTQTFASGSGITVASNSNIHTFSLETFVVTETGAQTLTNKVLTTPTVSSFINATHSHTNNATGGLISGNQSSITGIGVQTQNLNLGANNILDIGTISFGTAFAEDFTTILKDENDDLIINVAGYQGLRLVESGTEIDTIIGKNAELALSATSGHLHIPTCDGIPTGTPQAYNGKIPIIYDKANNSLFAYNATQWHSIGGGSGTPITAGTGLTLFNNVMSITAGVQSTITGLGQQSQNLDMLDSNILFNTGAGNASISTDVNGYLAFNVPTTTDLIRFTVNNQTRLSISNAIISTPVGLYVGSTNGISFGNNTRIHHAGNQLDLDVNTVPGITIFNASSSTLPDVAVGSLADLPLTAATGFLHIPTMAGSPTGTPTIRTGKVPLVYDTTNNALYVFSNSQWRAV